ncbi:MAG: protein kinase [Rudaea sp.]|nr:protein kinase [Rudaea sp.]
MATGSIQIPGYEMLRPLGSGGMSTVYLALQRSLDRKVAIKIMRRSGDSESADVVQSEKRFLLEGRMMAKLPHRNIVAVYDIVSNDAVAYISMEYLDGGTLSDRMKTGLALAEAVSVIVQIASALEFAHKGGVIHRDLKPANIMFRDSGTPVLTDFGIARMQDGSATRLTQTGMLVGTPTYMSPEQINGVAVDGRADLYSLGILFYELLTGAAPFRGDSPIAVLMAHLTQPPPPLPVEFRSFQDVLDRMLAKNRDERYAGMKEFTHDLKARLVQSDTLMTRLHVDPNETSSEQLRALGFSTSSPTGEGLRDSLLNRLPGASRSGPAVEKRAAPAAVVPAPETTPRWMWATAAAGVILIMIGAWLAFHGRGGLSKDDQLVVKLFLGKAQQLADAGNPLLPPDENAFAYVQKALQRDPDNVEAQALIERIGSTLAGQARQALAAGKLDEAADLDNQALLVRPDDAASRSLQTQIAQTRKAAQVKAQLQGLLERAETARVAGRAFGEGGAYTLLEQAHALVPGDAEVQKRIDAVVAQQLDAPRQALTAGQPTAAADELKKLEPRLGTEPAFLGLRGEIDTALKKQKVDKALTTLLARGTGQLRAGHLDEPGGDNAYETLGELDKLAADDQRVTDFAGAIARALLADARKLDSSGQSPRALERADLAVKVAPTQSDAQALKDQIELRLGARATKLAQTLGAARQAIAEQRFVPPAKDDAYAALGAVLALDPGNADARQLLAALPKRIADAAAVRAQTDAGAAVAMIDAARRVFVQDAALAALAQKLQTQLDTEKSLAQAQAVRERIAKVVATPAPAVEQLRAAAKDLGDLLGANPADQETLALRTQLIDAIGADLQAAPGVVQFDAFAALLKEQEKLLAGDRAFAPLAGTLPGLRAKVDKAEQARAEAERGTLVLNAYPWGKVESVLDASRLPVTLPADTTTPLVLTLPAGSYVITFRHPQAAKPAQVIAKVEAQKRATANAAFPTISAQEYFSRAGW